MTRIASDDPTEHAPPVAPPPPAGVRAIRDIVYASIDGVSLQMDIYMPENAAAEALPCVMYIHGGGWCTGDKSRQTAVPLTGHGYIVASINHRTSAQATFPAQIHDVKAAVRFLRAHAARYNLDPARIGAWGDSSGGHLASLLGASAGVKELEGTVGNDLQYSSRVSAVCDRYGPIDFLAIMNQNSNLKRGHYPEAPETRLLGGPTLEKKQLAIQACPLTYINKNTPPYLIIHGTDDIQVPLAQSEALRDALRSAGVDVTYQLIPGAGHGFTPEHQAQAFPFALAFFNRHLKAAMRQP